MKLLKLLGLVSVEEYDTLQDDFDRYKRDKVSTNKCLLIRTEGLEGDYRKLMNQLNDSISISDVLVVQKSELESLNASLESDIMSLKIERSLHLDALKNIQDELDSCV